MADADRNVWDPKTPTDPPGFTELAKRGFAVDLCIYILEHSAKDERTVQADVKAASEIWCQRQINIQVVHLERLGTLPPPTSRQEGQVDLNSPNLADQSIACTPPDPVRDQFLNIPRTGCPDITRSIPVFYIPGPRFLTGGTGCHMYYLSAIDVDPQHLILLSDEADGRVLAHELGHALFTRNVNAHTWINHDPDPNGDPIHPIHNTDRGNLMFPQVPAKPVISREQGAQAQQCLLTHDRQLVYGFQENRKFKLGVNIKSMTVHSSEDEATSDDALESSWNFKASIVRSSDKVELASKSETWSMDPLHWYTYQLDKDLAPLEVSSDTDTLVVEVTGSDWDFGPNDTLPAIREEWLKSVDSWGAKSTNVSGGQPGDHVEHRNNEDINYSLMYNIRVIDQPKETVFRTLC